MVSSYRIAPNPREWIPPPPPPPPGFDSLTIPTSASATASIFVAQYETSGRVLWVTRIQALNMADYTTATDTAGNIYVPITWSSGNAVIYDAAGNVATTTSGTTSGVVKYNSSGTYLWFLSTPSLNIRGFSIAPNQDFVIAGTFSSATISVRNLDFSIYSTLTRINGTDCLIARYNSAGLVQWVAQQTATPTPFLFLFSMACDASSIVVCGGGQGTYTAFNANGTTGATKTLDPSTGGYITKYNSAGVVQWGTTGNLRGSFYTNLTLDASGNVYVAGQGANNPIFYNADGSVFRSPTIGTRFATCLLKYTSSGVGSYLFLAAGSTAAPAPQCLTVDVNGNVGCGITSSGTANNFYTFTNDDGSTVAGPTNASYYWATAKVSATGSVSWVNNVFTNTAGQHTPLSIVPNALVGFYQAGYVQAGTSTFTNVGGGVGATLGGTNTLGGVLAKYDVGGNVLWAARQNQAGGIMTTDRIALANGNVAISGTYRGTFGATIYSAGL